MRVPRKGLFVLSLLLAAPSGSLIKPALAGDAAAGRARARAACAICHGEDGVAVLPGAAHLSGQQKEYLREQLRAYRSGRRQDPQMSIVANPLTVAVIEKLAEWYSSFKITIEVPK